MYGDLGGKLKIVPNGLLANFCREGAGEKKETPRNRYLGVGIEVENEAIIASAIARGLLWCFAEENVRCHNKRMGLQ